jgi:hypothetical protein
MEGKMGSAEIQHPNPFSLAKIHSFFNKRGNGVTVFTGENWYMIRWKGKPLARIQYHPGSNEWTIDSFHEKALEYAYNLRSYPRYKYLSCWIRWEDGLKHLEQALKKSLELRVHH